MIASRCVALLVMASFAAPLVAQEGSADLPPGIVVPQGVNQRFPARIADWLWTRPEYAGFITAEFRDELETDIRHFESLRDVDSPSATSKHDAAEHEIANKLTKKFAVRDFTAGKTPIVNRDTGLSVVMILDPKFDGPSQRTLERAAELFLAIATDKEVIQTAIDDSIAAPTPQPEKLKLKDGQPVLDRYQHPQVTDDYQQMRDLRVLPPSAEFLQAQLKEAYPSPLSEPGLLVVSQYQGNEWWGAGYNNFFYTDVFRLKREQPTRGYVYIRLNSDMLKSGVANHDDPAFWASKFAHETLHNLGYWHPNYKNPAERDLHNPPGKRCFVVAYELAVAAAAAKRLSTP